VQPPTLSKDALNVLSYQNDDNWILTSTDKPDTYKFKTDDLRMSVVYRARCFKDEAESIKFGGSGGPEHMTLD
jgi:hypothetical protein